MTVSESSAWDDLTPWLNITGAAPRTTIAQNWVAYTITGRREPGVLVPIPVTVSPACDRRRQHSVELGLIQQRATPHSKWRLGASGNTRLLRSCGHHLRCQPVSTCPVSTCG